MTALLWFGWLSSWMRKGAGLPILQDEWMTQSLWEYV